MHLGYKYRNLEKYERDLISLVNNNIYASPFSDLNDPFEGSFNEEISFFLEYLKQFSNVDSSEVLKIFKNIKEFNSKLGIYSLGSNHLNELMWSHYSSSHMGFCIEYDMEILKGSSPRLDNVIEMEVQYQDQFPQITIKDIGSVEMIRKMFATKHSKWSYENESRLIYNSYGLKSHHPFALKAIYFGLKMSKENKSRLIESLTGRDVKFYQLYFENTSYALQSDLIYENRRFRLYSLDSSDYEILETKHSLLNQVYYILYKSSKLDKKSIKNFIAAFVEEFAYKNVVVNLFDDKCIQRLIGVYPLVKNDYIKYADHYIIQYNSELHEEISWFPYQDYKYKEYGGNNLRSLPESIN